MAPKGVGRVRGLDPTRPGWRGGALPLRDTRLLSAARRPVHLPRFDAPAKNTAPGAGGGGRIRTYVGIRRQIYSLLPLTTRPPLRDLQAAHFAPPEGGAPRNAGHKSFTLDCQHAEARVANPKSAPYRLAPPPPESPPAPPCHHPLRPSQP